MANNAGPRLGMVDDIIALAQITDNDEKKRLLTSYLPARKRETWRELKEYAAGTPYTDFKKAVLKVYPSEEGKLTRFGIRFKALVKKLGREPAIILNKEACRRYLEALERGFAETLKMAINTRNLIKEDLRQAGINQPAAGTNAVDHRKEDPILLEELIKMAERLASTGGTEATWGEEENYEVKRSDRFPAVKIERRDARLEELGGELSSLRDAMTVVQKQSRAAHEELMKVLQNTKGQPRDENEGRDAAPRAGMSNSYGQDRQYNRGYGQCTVKAAHIQKGWIMVEDGQQKLADGNFIPRGRGSPVARVEEYWQRKGAAGQHFYDSFYGGAPEDEFDSLRDEIRTLRVKLSQVTNERATPIQPTYMVNTPAQVASPYMSPAAPAQPIDMGEFGRAVFNMMRMGNQSQDQYVQTRTGARFLKDPRMEARAKPGPSKPPEGSKMENKRKEKEKGRTELPYRFVKPVDSEARTLPVSTGNAERVIDDSGKAYRLKAPIQREGLTEEILGRINDTEVTVRLGDLFGISKDLREGEKLRLTRVRELLKERELVLPAKAAELEQQNFAIPVEQPVEQDCQLMGDAMEGRTLTCNTLKD
ncbi:hypothetical protein B0H13DRAFT_1926683 [Mycena leptocephala]|nr:hypothetical protein B0H13DRAFT_1926683 [Mycena leptocephala]